MDEARAVLERLDRIERSEDREELTAQLRELVREVEAWVEAVGVKAEAAMIPT